MQRDWALKHGFEIAKKINDCGGILSCLVFKTSSEYFIENQKDVKFEHIIKDSVIEKNFEEIVNKSNYDLIKFKNDFNVDKIWEHAATLRRYSLSYDKKYPYSYQQNVNDNEIIKYILAFAHEISSTFKKFKPDLVIGYNFGDLRHFLINKLCDKNRIPFFCSSGTKVSGNACFAYDFNGDKSFFKNYNIKLNKNSEIHDNYKDQAEKYFKESLADLKLPSHMKTTNLNISLLKFSDIYKLLKKIFYHFKKGKINKRLLDSSDNTSFRLLIRDFIKERINVYNTKKIVYDDFDKIENFAYLPLQHYPESQLGLLNTSHDNQINTARIIARHLPKNLTLVVKDHPWSIGKKSISYLLKLKNSLNVKLINYKIPNKKIYKKMSYLISFGGTAIFESAFERKPAIQLGSFGGMSELPNIYILKNLDEIDKLIKKIDDEFETNVNDKNYKKKIINYISAALNQGFDVNKYHDDYRVEKKSLEYMWSKYKNEFEKIFTYKSKFIFK